MTREQWDNAVNPLDEHDPERPTTAYLACEADDCHAVCAQGSDYCPPHQQEHDDARAMSDEPDDPDAEWDDRDLL